MCCFFQPDVRYQLLRILCRILEKLECCSKITCFTCFRPDFVQRLRHEKLINNRHGSFSIKSRSSFSTDRSEFSSTSSVNTVKSFDESMTNMNKSKNQNTVTTAAANRRNSNEAQRLLCLGFNFLFDKSKKNDFHHHHHHNHSHSMHKYKMKILSKLDNKKSNENSFHIAKHVKFARNNMMKTDTLLSLTIPLTETHLNEDEPASEDIDQIVTFTLDCSLEPPIFDEIETFIDDEVQSIPYPIHNNGDV
jgi:hypothetical protein